MPPCRATARRPLLPRPTGGGDDGGPGGDLLPSSGLVTSSEDYYPTVAINALMRVLRDPALASQHLAVIRALLSIFRALQLNVVPFLPKVGGGWRAMHCGQVVKQCLSWHPLLTVVSSMLHVALTSQRIGQDMTLLSTSSGMV